MNHRENYPEVPTFDIQNLKLWYFSKEIKALDGINLKIFDSQINVILGQNGSGKSSLLKCLAGVQKWNEGDIFRHGRSRKTDLENFNSDQIFISEDITLPQFPLNELVEIYSSIWIKFDTAVFQRIISIGDISMNKRSSQLSRGQKILVQFALGLATGCKIILIDEVTAALDPYVRGSVAEELLVYQKQHSATVILATNIATEFHTDVQLILLKRGEIYLQGASSELAKEFVRFKVPRDRPANNKNWVPLQTSSRGEQWIISQKQDFTISDGFEVDARPVSIEEIFVYLSFRGK
ncbi:ATP-binding cassette domain-containing protein [Bdellovibrio sp.]|uniref:ATP-binding cassette domain-containing protein n=1 Tax=Bdellovibrio TaxID=958 RepID=UPI0032218369